jgi:hypothetical protein
MLILREQGYAAFGSPIKLTEDTYTTNKYTESTYIGIETNSFLVHNNAPRYTVKSPVTYS